MSECSSGKRFYPDDDQAWLDDYARLINRCLKHIKVGSIVKEGFWFKIKLTNKEVVTAQYRATRLDSMCSISTALSKYILYMYIADESAEKEEQ